MLGNEAELLQIRDIKRHLQAIRNYMQQDLQVIVISLPGVGRFTHWCLSPTPMCKTNPQKGKKTIYYIACYLGNITVQERYGQHS